MKKVRVSLMALALTIGVGGAFATNAKHAKKFDNPNWQTADASGNVVPTSSGGIYDANRSLADAQSDYGCEGSTNFCAVTVTGENGSKTDSPQYIYKN